MPRTLSPSAAESLTYLGRIAGVGRLEAERRRIFYERRRLAIRAARTDGLSVAAIARALGVTRNIVIRACKEPE